MCIYTSYLHIWLLLERYHCLLHNRNNSLWSLTHTLIWGSKIRIFQKYFKASKLHFRSILASKNKVRGHEWKYEVVATKSHSCDEGDSGWNQLCLEQVRVYLPNPSCSVSFSIPWNWTLLTRVVLMGEKIRQELARGEIRFLKWVSDRSDLFPNL